MAVYQAISALSGKSSEELMEQVLEDWARKKGRGLRRKVNKIVPFKKGKSKDEKRSFRTVIMCDASYKPQEAKGWASIVVHDNPVFTKTESVCAWDSIEAELLAVEMAVQHLINNEYNCRPCIPAGFG